MDCGYFSGRYRQQLKCHVSLPGPMPSEVNLGVRRFISAFQSRVRTSPLASELPLTCQALPFAGSPGGPLTCRATPANSSPFAALTTPKGLRSLRSASSLSFLVTCQRQVIPSHSFAALTALVVRHENGNVALLVCRGNGLVDQPRLACTSRRTPSVGALACAPGGGTLPPALVVRRVKGFVDQPRLASTSRRTPPVGALACAPGSGTLPPVLWHLLFSAKGLLQLYQSRMRLSIGAAEFFTIFLSWSGKGGEIQLLRAARKAEGETP